MKYRIVEKVEDDGVHFFVVEKWLLFIWWTCEKWSESPASFFSKKEAEDFIKNRLTPDKVVSIINES